MERLERCIHLEQRLSCTPTEDNRVYTLNSQSRPCKEYSDGKLITCKLDKAILQPVRIVRTPIIGVLSMIQDQFTYNPTTASSPKIMLILE